MIRMESSGYNSAYIPHQFAFAGVIHLVLSQYATQSHNFANLNFCDVTLLFCLLTVAFPDVRFLPRVFNSLPFYG